MGSPICDLVRQVPVDAAVVSAACADRLAATPVPSLHRCRRGQRGPNKYTLNKYGNERVEIK